MSKFKYPRGSEWRKWDLHVHTPFSILNNQFGNYQEETTWDDYVKELFRKAIEKKIVVIGITDYFSIDGYEKIKNEYLGNEKKLSSLFKNDEIESIKKILILPNIEFRLNKFVGRNSINFHVIFSDEVHINDIKENFLHEIDFVYEGNPQSQDEKWKLKIENLERLGEKLKKEHSEFKGKSDLLIGMKNAVVDDSQILEVLNKKPSIFKGKYLIVLPADEDLSKIDWNSRDHNTRKVVIQKSDILFSPNEDTREWALGKKYEKLEDFISEFKSLKPCIWGSDAHSFDRLFEPNLKRYTWIKADPTFEGLKQIIYEPEERVYIGEEPPRKIERNKVIKSITISNSNNWFENKPILLNEGLVSIIGGKGTGKTAILDLIAYATESYKCYEKDENKSKSFLKKAFKELKGTKIKVEWEDGNSNEKEIKDKLEEFVKEGKVRYLPQDYVDQLCSEIGKNELERQIEDVIFQEIPPELKATYTDFKSYKDAQLKVINNNKNRIVEQIRDINYQIYQHNSLIKSKPEKKEEIKKIEERIKRFEKEIERISEAVKGSEEQKEILTKLQNLTKEKSDLERAISQLNTKLLKIEEIKNEIVIFFENSRKSLDKLKE
ncbi:MAG: AAA family ATPase, partial [Deferribacterales bacterium]|nr:AAA family ATPase [Deferribacterales bacterium]